MSVHQPEEKESLPTYLTLHPFLTHPPPLPSLSQGSCTPLMVATLHPHPPTVAGVAPQYSVPLGLGCDAGHPTLLEHTATVLQAWPAGTQQILIPSSWQQVPGVAIHGSAHQTVVAESPVETLHPDTAAQHTNSWRYGYHHGYIDVCHNRPLYIREQKAVHR
uniref:homeodomain-interacting protein kinase 1-like n=1 Tax=Oncorhynchus gorbuscha TaxID=8017 RepID=UPI001EAF2550|nr:homeodomain-interacting protein kinase 1-like [Oncorhynchus gorbuscha]